jgi:hypothetical protein
MDKPKRKNYRWEYQNKVKNGLIVSIDLLFQDMKKKYYSHSKFLDEGGRRILSTESFSVLTVYNRQYLYGYIDALYNDIWNNLIVWKHYHPEKGLIESKKVPSTDWSRIISEKSGYVWKENDLPFYMSGEHKNITWRRDENSAQTKP